MRKRTFHRVVSAKAAIPLQQSAPRNLTAEHPDIAISLNNLALLLSDTNRPAEAEPLYRGALAIYEKSLGPNHPSVATGLNNLAELLSNTNRLAEAEPLYRKVVRILAEFGHRTGPRASTLPHSPQELRRAAGGNGLE